MNGHLSLVPAPAPVEAKGRHAGHGGSYLEQWAERYPVSQAAAERGRLKQGKARRRAHRDPLPVRAGRK